MYLHLGEEKLIAFENIIGIFDLDTTTVSKPSRDFLKKAELGGRVVNVSYELPKSFILSAEKNKESKVYIAQLSTSTLLKRVKNPLK
ncbi:MAG: DUF370 domain-containing protein [Clostridiales bacterium]|nr:DUF370 domain-containing protein [Clostridiales bacterium]